MTLECRHTTPTQLPKYVPPIPGSTTNPVLPCMEKENPSPVPVTHYCPICMDDHDTIFQCHCCMNSICHGCLEELIARHVGAWEKNEERLRQAQLPMVEFVHRNRNAPGPTPFVLSHAEVVELVRQAGNAQHPEHNASGIPHPYFNPAREDFWRESLDDVRAVIQAQIHEYQQRCLRERTVMDSIQLTPPPTPTPSAPRAASPGALLRTAIRAPVDVLEALVLSEIQRLTSIRNQQEQAEADPAKEEEAQTEASRPHDSEGDLSSAEEETPACSRSTAIGVPTCPFCFSRHFRVQALREGAASKVYADTPSLPTAALLRQQQEDAEQDLHGASDEMMGCDVVLFPTLEEECSCPLLSDALGLPTPPDAALKQVCPSPRGQRQHHSPAVRHDRRGGRSAAVVRARDPKSVECHAAAGEPSVTTTGRSSPSPVRAGDDFDDLLDKIVTLEASTRAQRSVGPNTTHTPSDYGKESTSLEEGQGCSGSTIPLPSPVAVGSRRCTSTFHTGSFAGSPRVPVGGTEALFSVGAVTRSSCTRSTIATSISPSPFPSAQPRVLDDDAGSQSLPFSRAVGEGKRPAGEVATLAASFPTHTTAFHLSHWERWAPTRPKPAVPLPVPPSHPASPLGRDTAFARRMPGIDSAHCPRVSQTEGGKHSLFVALPPILQPSHRGKGAGLPHLDEPVTNFDHVSIRFNSPGPADHVRMRAPMPRLCAYVECYTRLAPILEVPPPFKSPPMNVTTAIPKDRHSEDTLCLIM